MNSSVVFKDDKLTGDLRSIYDSRCSPFAVLVEHDSDGAAAAMAVRDFCAGLPDAVYIEGEASSPYPFLVPCGAFFYAIYCARERFDNFSAIDADRVDRIAAALKIGGSRAAERPGPFDLITSFYGFKRRDSETAPEVETFQQIINVLLHISEKSNIVFQIKNADMMDDDSIALIDYVCRNVSGKKIFFILTCRKDSPAMARKAAKLNSSIFGRFQVAPVSAGGAESFFRAGGEYSKDLAFLDGLFSGSRSLTAAALEFLRSRGVVAFSQASMKYEPSRSCVPGGIAAAFGPGPHTAASFAAAVVGAREGAARDVLAAASIFHGDFRSPEVAICLGLPGAAVETELEALRRAGILYRSAYGGVFSFSHPLFAQAAAAAAPKERALEFNLRLLEFFRGSVYELPNIALGRLIYHAMKTASYSDIAIFTERLAETLCDIGGAGRALKLVRFFEIIVLPKKDARSPVTPWQRLRVLMLHARILVLMGRYAPARDILLRVLETLSAPSAPAPSEADLRRRAFEAEKWLGYIYMVRPSLSPGEDDGALKRFTSALGRQMSSVRGRIEITNLIALLHYHRSELEKASIFYRDSLKTLAMKKNEAGLWIELDSAQRGLSSVYLRQGEFRKALAYLKKCEELCAAAGNKKMLSNTYHYIGMLHHSRGEYGEAVANYEKAIGISASISDILAQSRLWTSLGVTHFNLANYRTALDFFNRSMQVALSTSSKKAVAILNGNIARVQAVLNNMEAAFFALREDIAILNEINDLYGLAHAYAYLGDAFHMDGKAEEARDYYAKSFEISKKSQFLRPMILSACGLIASTPPHLLSQQAQGMVNELMLIDSREIDIVSKSMILRARCAYETASGTYHRATCFINQALINFEKMNMPLETALCLVDEANIMRLNGLFDMAESKKAYAVEIFDRIGAEYYARKYRR